MYHMMHNIYIYIYTVYIYIYIFTEPWLYSHSLPWPSPWCRQVVAVLWEAPGLTCHSGPWPQRSCRWCWGWVETPPTHGWRCSACWCDACARAAPEILPGCPRLHGCWTRRQRSPPPSLCCAGGSWRCWPGCPSWCAMTACVREMRVLCAGKETGEMGGFVVKGGLEYSLQGSQCLYAVSWRPLSLALFC